jgi:fucose 4-O-acetylase-like acetyltransferase
MSAGRIDWIDTARGLGILLVVVGHVERGLVDAGVADAADWRLFDTALYSFHMPLFMLLAGVHVPLSLARGRRAFLVGKLRGLYYPYLLWSLIQGVLMLTLAGGGGQGAQWSDLYQLPWRPMWHFWFLAALMLYMALVACTGARAAPLGLAALAALGASQTMEVGGSLLYRLLFYFPFFAAGVLLSPRIRTLRLRSPAQVAALAGVAWAACLALLPWHEAHAYMTIWAIPAACAGSLALLALAQALRAWPTQVLAIAGRWSLSIYVMHVMAAAATRMLLLRLLPGLPSGALFLSCVIVGLIAPMAVHMLARRLGMLEWLGLGQSRRSRDAE